MSAVSNAGQSLTYRSGNTSVAAASDTAGEGLAGLQFLTKLASDLSGGTVDLPCFPNVVVKIRDALSNPKTSVEETVKLVGAEPRLAARLIQTVNSAAFNTSGKRVTDLKTAITRLGQQLVYSAAMSFAVQQMQAGPELKSIVQPMRRLWRDSITVACICQLISRHTKVNGEEAFLAGLLHGIGRLYIMANAVGKQATVEQDLASAQLVSGWHPSIGKSVLENWALGEAICEAVGEQIELDRPMRGEAGLTDVLVASILLAQGIGEQSVNIDAARMVLKTQSKQLQRVGLTGELCANILKQAQAQLVSVQEALGC